MRDGITADCQPRGKGDGGRDQSQKGETFHENGARWKTAAGMRRRILSNASHSIGIEGDVIAHDIYIFRQRLRRQQVIKRIAMMSRERSNEIEMLWQDGQELKAMLRQ